MLRKNSQTSEENVFIRVVTCQVPGLELATLSKKSVRYKYFAVKFVKILKQLYAEQLGTAAFGCPEAFYETNILETENSSQKLQQWN